MYLFKPRPIKEYELLAKSAKHMALFDVRVSGTGELEESMQQIQTMLTPTIEKLTELGLINRTYIYGFDELSQTHNRSVYEMFGKIKKRWPEIRTMAALDWETMQSDVPVDIWIDEIADYGSSPDYRTPTPKERVRQRWLASPGKQFYWYWCIGPSDTRMLNTFVERPAVHGRMLFWLNALHAVDGMAYYSADIWQNQCPDQRPCASATRINGTALTSFNPATWNENNNSTSLQSEIAELRAAVKEQGESMTRVLNQLTRQSSRVRALEGATRSGSKKVSSSSRKEDASKSVASRNLNSSTLCRFHNKRRGDF